jgi:hypothetical protein
MGEGRLLVDSGLVSVGLTLVILSSDALLTEDSTLEAVFVVSLVLEFDDELPDVAEEMGVVTVRSKRGGSVELARLEADGSSVSSAEALVANVSLPADV